MQFDCGTTERTLNTLPWGFPLCYSRASITRRHSGKYPMRALLPLLVFALLVTGCASQKMASGVDLDALDTQVRPQDDFYHYVAGSWLRNTEIPADKSSTGHFSRLADEVDADIRTIIESAAAAGESSNSARELQIAQLYQSFQDVDRINAGGLWRDLSDISFEQSSHAANMLTLASVWKALPHIL